MGNRQRSSSSKSNSNSSKGHYQAQVNLSRSSTKAHQQAHGNLRAEENQFKVALRVQGIPQDAVLEDQGRMTQIQELVDKLRSEYQTESIVADLGKKGNFNRFSAASKRIIFNLGTIELYELGEMSKKTQCQSCSKYSVEGLLYCSCGVCLMPSLEQKRKIKSESEILSVPFYVVTTDSSRGARRGHS